VGRIVQRFMKSLKILAVLILIQPVLFGCKARKATLTEVKPTTTAEVTAGLDVAGTAADSLYHAVKASNYSSKWFSARAAVDVALEKDERSFQAHIKICKDSLIWISISPALGIEVARVLIEPDTVRFINRIEGTYFIGDFGYLSNLLQADLSFELVQAVLLGDAYLHYSVDKYIQDIENNDYVLSTFKKRKIKRENELEIPEILTQEIWYSPITSKVNRMEMRDYRPVRSFNVSYLNREIVDSIAVPSRIELSATANKSLRLTMDYSKISVNKKQNISFTIPEDYEPIR
jgi:hypothetical protein